MDAKKIGELIKKKRLELELTQNELASKLNITDKAISKWEQGLGCPDISIIKYLSNILGISTEELLEGEEKEGGSINYIKKYSNVRTRNKDRSESIIKFCILFLVIFALLGTIISLLGNTLKIYSPVDDLYLVIYDEDNMSELYKDTKKKIEVIKKDDKILYTNEEKQVIVDYLTYLDNNINELIKIMDKDSKINFYKIPQLFNDVFSMSGPDKKNKLSNIAKIMKKYTNKGFNDHIKTFDSYEEYRLNFYKSSLLSEQFNKPKLYYKNYVSNVDFNIDWKIKYFNEITNFLMEVGEVNE